ncbi:MAG: thiolase family protein [Anaerolineales bacterium]|jgi:acetyl-CoA acyltransferase
MTRNAYIVAAARSPVGIGKADRGALAPLAPVDLAAHVLNAALERAGIGAGQVEDVILGCVTPIRDQGANIARLALLQAGFPYQVPGVQLNRMCGSGQQAVHFASQAILAGDMDLVLAGGIEMMSHQPLGADYPESWPENFPYALVHQGISAEMMAERWELGRDELDDYAFESHRRAAEAIRAGRSPRQIAPVEVTFEDGKRIVEHDQGVRMEPDREKMSALKPVFKEDGVITAGNSSQISDGAAALLIASEEAIQRHGLKPMARVAARVVIGSDPVLMLDGPIQATRQVLERAGLSLSQIDVVEINEAFASVVLAWAKEFGADLERVNPDGGAIAHGHPLGATGAILMTKLVYELQDRQARWGLQTMCIGHGMATATIIERIAG